MNDELESNTQKLKHILEEITQKYHTIQIGDKVTYYDNNIKHVEIIDSFKHLNYVKTKKIEKVQRYIGWYDLKI